MNQGTRKVISNRHSSTLSPIPATVSAFLAPATNGISTRQIGEFQQKRHVIHHYREQGLFEGESWDCLFHR
jgi:hypothetical protein